MKDLSGVLKVLKILQKNFENYNKLSRKECCGMCVVVWRNLLQNGGPLTREDEDNFYKYYQRSKRSQKWFYNSNGFKVTDRDQFGWHPYYPEFRSDWINHHIDRIESGKSLW